jgi:hypothetical protein
MAGEGQVRTRQAAGVMNLLRPRTRLEARTHFFSVRAVDSWNGLSDRIKLARSIGQIKQLHKPHRSNRTRREPSRYLGDRTGNASGRQQPTTSAIGVDVPMEAIPQVTQVSNNYSVPNC